MKITRPGKVENLLEQVDKCIEKGEYQFTRHALERQKERLLSLQDILYVLKHGYHEKSKDSWDEAFSAWNYSIRGKALDNEDVRIVVSFDKDGLLIITVIRLDK